MARQTVSDQAVEPIGVYDPSTLPAHRRRRRQRMIQAAIELIEEADYEAIQIRDVAQRADVALGTVYRYFSSKEHLYAAALAEWAAGFVPHLVRPGAEADTDEERLRRLLRRVVRSFEKWPQMMRAEMVLESSTDPNAQALLVQFSQRHDGAIRSVLRDMSPTSAEAVAHVMQSVMYRGLRSWALGRCSIADVDRQAQTGVDLIFTGPPA